MASSVTAPLERQFGQVPGLDADDLDELFGSSLITLQFALDLEYRYCGATSSGCDQRGGTYLPRDLPNPPIYSKVNPADAPILTLALTSDTLPLSKVEDLADTALAQKISQLPGVGLVSHQWRTEASRADAGESDSSRIVRPESRRHANCAGRGQRRSGEGRLRRISRSRSRSAPTISCSRAHDYQQRHHRLPERRAGAVVGCRHVIDGAENVKQAAWMNDDTGGHSQHSAAAGRQHHWRCGSHQEAPAAVAGFAASCGKSPDPDRPHDRRSARPLKMCSSS